MKKVTVAYSDIDNINNHLCLFPSFVTKIKDEVVQVMLHTTPMDLMAGDTLLANYDLLIKSSECKKEFSGKVHTLKRVSKVEQALRLREHHTLRKVNDDNICHRPIRTWSSAQALASSNVIGLRHMIIKHNNGARGICQLLLRNVETCNHSTLFKRFQDAMVSIKAEVINKTDHKAINKIMIHHFVDLITMDNAPNMEVLWSGIEARDLGDMDELFDSESYHAQEMNEDSIAEYRAIYLGSKSTPNYYLRRTRDDRPFKQSTGSNFVDCFDKIPELTTEANNELLSVMQGVVPTLNSVDIIIYPDPTGNKFSIVEYCNQFGVLGVHSNYIRDAHIAYLTKAIENAGVLR